jgi:hypothetical protein
MQLQHRRTAFCVRSAHYSKDALKVVNVEGPYCIPFLMGLLQKDLGGRIQYENLM